MSKTLISGSSASLVDFPDPGGPNTRTRPDGASPLAGAKAGGATASSTNIGLTSQYTNAWHAAYRHPMTATSQATLRSCEGVCGLAVTPAADSRARAASLPAVHFDQHVIQRGGSDGVRRRAARARPERRVRPGSEFAALVCKAAVCSAPSLLDNSLSFSLARSRSSPEVPPRSVGRLEARNRGQRGDDDEKRGASDKERMPETERSCPWRRCLRADDGPVGLDGGGNDERCRGNQQCAPRSQQSAGDE